MNTPKVMLIKGICIPIFLLLSTFQLNSQCSTSAPFCDQAIPLCQDFVSVTLPDQLNNFGPIPACGGGWSLHNSIWYSIIPETDLLAITISAGNCFPGTGGYQAGLYTACDPNAPPLAVQCACTYAPTTLAGPVIPGQTYYLLVDGCSGDICELDIAVVAGSIFNCPAFPLQIPDAPVVDFNPACEGQVLSFSVPAVADADFYEWNFPAGVIPLSIDCNNATVIWGNNPGDVTVSVFNTNTPQGVTSPPTFIDLNIPQGFEFGSYCFPDEPGWLHPGTNTYWPGGNFELILPGAAQNGCDSVVTLMITEYASAMEFLNFTLCGGDSVVLNGTTYSTTGTFTQVIQNGTINGCDSTIFIIIQASNFDLNNEVTTDATCGECNGQISFSPACGQAPVSIVWSNNLAQDQSEQNNLCPGTYGVTLTDGAGEEIIRNYMIEDLPGLALQSAVSDITCNGDNDGQIMITVLGGITPYSFDWSDNQYDGQNNLTGLAPGTYTLTITDASNCASIETYQVEEPLVLEVVLAGNNVQCGFDGNIVSTVLGGTGPYSYQWSNGATSSSIDSLVSGVYTLVVFDENGCRSEETIDIDSELMLDGIPVDSFQSGLATNDTLACGESTIDITPLVYDNAVFRWRTNNGSIVGTNGAGTILRVDGAGVYVVEIGIEENGVEVCTLIDSIEIIVECCPVEFDMTAFNETCQGIDDGRIFIDPVSGRAPFSYAWSDSTFQDRPFAGLLAAGTYTVTMTDNVGCTAVDSIEVSSYLNLSVTTTPADCDGTGGTATASASGFFIYYEWSNGGRGATQRDLDVGEYTVRAWSIFGGCQSQITFNIELDTSCNDAANENSLVAFETEGENDIRMSSYALNAPKLNILPGTAFELMPNPMTGRGQIQITTPNTELIEILIFNAEGRLVERQNQSASKGKNSYRIDLSDQTAGLYFVQVKSTNYVSEVKKWVKMR